MRMLATLAFALTATVTLAASPEMGGGYGAIDAPRDTDPLTLARQFCDTRVAHTGMDQLAPYFAPKLALLPDQTSRSQSASAVPCQSYRDAPTGCTVEVLNGHADTIGVLIRLHYTAPKRQWSDTLNFERTTDSWWINNVFYEHGGNLRFTLFEGAWPLFNGRGRLAPESRHALGT